MPTTILPRTLGLRDMILLTIGSGIGSGIFLVPGAVMRQIEGFVPLALLVWTVGGVLSVLGALTYGELGAMKPQAGDCTFTSEIVSANFLRFFASPKRSVPSACLDIHGRRYSLSLLPLLWS